MTLLRLKDFEASSRRSFRKNELTHFDVYATSGEKAGQVVDVLVDETGHCEYLVVDCTGETAGKQVRLPKGDFQVDQTTHRIYVDALDRVQAAEPMAIDLTEKKTANAFGEEVIGLEYPL